MTLDDQLRRGVTLDNQVSAGKQISVFFFYIVNNYGIQCSNLSDKIF